MATLKLKLNRTVHGHVCRFLPPGETEARWIRADTPQFSTLDLRSELRVEQFADCRLADPACSRHEEEHAVEYDEVAGRTPRRFTFFLTVKQCCRYNYVL